MIPYGKQFIDEDDIKAVVEVLRSDWLTTGPKVSEFEEAFAQYVSAKHAVAVSSGTAALHAAMYAIGIGPCDEVILPPITFAATANCIVYQGGMPVFSDVELDTLLLDPKRIESKITSNTKVIIAVDYAGHPCDYDSLRKIADKNNFVLMADACHALGAEYNGQKVGSLSDLSIFSFHPVKHITTGEGGMITTDNADYASRMRFFRNHGITTDHHQREKQGSWFYEMMDLGYNYRMTDFQCALGISQLKKLPKFLERRREIAAIYDEAFVDISGIEPLGLRADVLPAKHYTTRPLRNALRSELHPMYSAPRANFISQNVLPNAPCTMPSKHAYHLYVVKVDCKAIGTDRNTLFQALHERGVGVNVHYIPVYLHPYYQKRFGYKKGLCPVAEEAYEQIFSLPIYPAMTDDDVEKVVSVVREIFYK